MAENDEKTVPYERFQAVVAERNALKEQHTELTRQLQLAGEKAATADTLASQLRLAQEASEKANARFDTYKTITAAGLSDPDIVEAVEWQYGRLPTEGRPPLVDVLKAWREKPEQAPAVLRPHLVPAGAGVGTGAGSGSGAGAGAGAGTGAGAGLPPANRGTQTFTGAPSQLNAQQIASLTPEQYRAQREAILAAAAQRSG